ncbi:hypothetical protein KEJ19_07440 [Candidatus Bathyarchaeota archaeon]|nr:hypothetical protein [Candidatus Bathyarchaeota archaeon]
MSQKKRGLKTYLRYVEDYLEELLDLLKVKEKAEVEVRIEEEKEESLKIRVILTTPDGKKNEMTGEASRLFLIRAPLSMPVNVRHPPELIRPVLPIENGILTEVRLQPLTKIRYPFQHSMRAFDCGVERILPLFLPFVSQSFYSWLRDDIKTVTLFEQPGITAFTLKHMLRLIEVSLKLPSISDEIKAKVNLPALASERFLLQQEIKATLTEAVETLRATAQIQQLKGIGLVELLIPDEREKLRCFLGASGEYVGEPVIIILPESKYHLWYLFWILCRELYREVKGAYPEPVVLLEEGCDVWLRHFGGLSGKIVVLKKECILSKKDVESNEKEKWFKRRLQEAFSQGLGFLIILAKEVDEAEEFVRELCKPYKARIIAIRTVPELNYILSHLARVLSTCFGVPYDEVCKIEGLEAKDRITTMIEGKLQEFPQLDIMVARVDRAYRDLLNELLLGNYLACVRRDVGEHESEDHVAMKILTIKNLHEIFGIKFEKITCTCEVGDKVIADVYVEEKALAVECETILGTAPAPLLKVFESVRKYIERPLTKPVNDVWVIVRNWSAILHLGDLLWAEDILKRELKQHNRKVRFFIPHIYGKSLQAIDDITRTVSLSRYS